MVVLTIVRLGHPALRKQSSPVTPEELATADFQTFLDDLAETCLASKGAVGIAAPQVGVNKRAIVVNIDPPNTRYPGVEPFPTTIVVNPRVVEAATEYDEGWEGDLSATLRGMVPRPKSCTVAGLTRDGDHYEARLDNPFHARVFQHEIDHLDGWFFLDRVERRETICEPAEWEKYWKDAPDEHAS